MAPLLPQIYLETFETNVPDIRRLPRDPSTAVRQCKDLAQILTFQSLQLRTTILKTFGESFAISFSMRAERSRLLTKTPDRQSKYTYRSGEATALIRPPSIALIDATATVLRLFCPINAKV
jgi:hypothetical protein